jgi:hypothetical protein
MGVGVLKMNLEHDSLLIEAVYRIQMDFDSKQNKAAD